jgi:hypothetical protein
MGFAKGLVDAGDRHRKQRWRTKGEHDRLRPVMEDRKFAVLFAATILAARKLSELEAQGITRPCPAREIIITDAISKA